MLDATGVRSVCILVYTDSCIQRYKRQWPPREPILWYEKYDRPPRAPEGDHCMPRATQQVHVVCWRLWSYTVMNVYVQLHLLEKQQQEAIELQSAGTSDSEGAHMLPNLPAESIYRPFGSEWLV